MFGMGFTEILVIAIIAILFLGPDKLPDTMVQIAKFFRNTKNTINNMKSTIEEEMNVKSMKEEALAYKKELVDASDKVKSATDIKQMAAKLTILEDDDFGGIFDAPEKPATPLVQSKPDEVTLPKKKSEETLEKKEDTKNV
ncbi:Sec-independent protein translocase protein TatB [Sulfurimonas sp.]|uniref:Sec-independent protein translocase protein TatB n=1 Tax=Sulfurimonas sp. TaxID=2022749 RepID=UPI003D0B74ED